MAAKNNHVAVADKYVKDVLSGKISTCKWTRLACKRHLKDLKKSKTQWRYKFDGAKADGVCNFLENFPHTKGKWASHGEPFVLSPWQCFLTCSIFGWVDKKTELRRFRVADLRVARKNGKSDWSARVGLYMLAADGEHGAEVYSGATTLEQAHEIFRPANKMASAESEYREAFGVEVMKTSVSILETGSRFVPLIGKPGDGASPSCALIDEYHEHATDEFCDTMMTGMGARSQPLMLRVSTSGVDMGGPCYAADIENQKILEGVVENDTRFVLMYGKDANDDWAAPESLAKANPNMGISVSEEFLLQQLSDAKNNARLQGAYRTKHLNEWVGARSGFFNMKAWDDCARPGLHMDNYAGNRAILSLDLASKRDIAALEILIFTGMGQYAEFGKYYLPRATVEMDAHAHYQAWERDGWLTVTEGNITDYDVIKDAILEIASRFELLEVVYDPFQSTMLVTQLMAEGLTCVELRNTVQNMSEPMKVLDALIVNGQLVHADNPVMTWMMSNVVAHEDAKENVFPRKEKAGNKIDGPVALIMAVNRATAQNIADISPAGNTIYNTEGIMVV